MGGVHRPRDFDGAGNSPVTWREIILTWLLPLLPLLIVLSFYLALRFLK